MNQSVFEKSYALQSLSEAEKLNFYNSTRLWHTKFNYQTFDIEELKSVHLEDNQKFITLLKSIQNFNKEIQHSIKNNRIVHSMPTRYNFYQNIVNLLREATIAKGRDAQLIFLDKVYQWFTSNNKEVIRTQEKDISSDDTRHVNRELNEITQLPSQNIEEQLKDYKQNQRTIHKSFDPPQLRLRQFKRRQFNQLNNLIPQLLNKSTFPKVQTNTQKEIQQDDNLLQSQEQTEGEIVIDNDLLGNDDDDNEKKKIVVNMIPKIKVFQKDDVDLEFQDLNKKFEQRQNYQVYQPSNQEIELNLQNRWLQFRLKEAQEKRLDEEIVQSMNHWSKNKARLEKEIDRRIESQNYGSRYSEIDKKRSYSLGIQSNQDSKQINLKPLPTIVQSQQYQTEQNNDYSFLENKVSAQRVINAKRAYKDILNLSANEISQEEQPNSLSIYATKHRSNSLYSKFSQTLQKNNANIQNEQNLLEVIEIKNRLAKHKIPVQINSLLAGIMIPTCNENYQNKLMDVGQSMLPNPFEEKKGKKKKKK